MKIHLPPTGTPKPSKPTIDQIVEFDPWPFDANTVALSGPGAWFVSRAYRCLAVLSDGTFRSELSVDSITDHHDWTQPETHEPAVVAWQNEYRGDRGYATYLYRADADHAAGLAGATRTAVIEHLSDGTERRVEL